MTCMKQEFCIHEKYCQRHIGQNFDSCILFSRNNKPMTNEEYLKSCTTEMLAVAIFRALCISAEMNHCEITIKNGSGTELKEAIYEWLKEIHQ